MLPLLEQAEGSVVNVGSVHEWSTKPGFVIYAASKAAIGGLTRSLAVDLGGRVRVNAVIPGAVDTPMLREGFVDRPEMIERLAECQPSERIAQPHEVAKAVVFLASESASAITGTSLRTDGGILVRLHEPA
jgi:NAD(P)-dependent dehydrogenase (short-subunit alcohol dehydrogenase family)